MSTEVKDVFWLELREPGCVPQRKGPFPHQMTAAHLREFMKARPTALISVISWAPDGPLITDAPETLQMLDGRSMSTGRKHIATSNAAHAAESRATAAEGRVALLEEALGTIIELLDSSIATHRFNAQHMIAEDTLVDAWGMLNLAREQFDTDANQLITIREAARARLAKGGQ